ncbi:hypothetical protein, partial [Nostoc sp.]
MKIHPLYWYAIKQPIKGRYRKLLILVFVRLLLPTGLIYTTIPAAQAQNVRIAPSATGGAFTSVVQGANATAIGSGASAQSQDSIAVGTNAIISTGSSTGAIAIGAGASVPAPSISSSGAIAIGQSSTANALADNA